MRINTTYHTTRRRNKETFSPCLLAWNLVHICRVYNVLHPCQWPLWSIKLRTSIFCSSRKSISPFYPSPWRHGLDPWKVLLQQRLPQSFLSYAQVWQKEERSKKPCQANSAWPARSTTASQQETIFTTATTFRECIVYPGRYCQLLAQSRMWRGDIVLFQGHFSIDLDCTYSYTYVCA